MSNFISVQTLQELHDGQSGIAWVHGLARAGVRRRQGALEDKLYALAHQLDGLEDQIESTMAADRFYFRLPTVWWAWVPLLFSGGFLYAAQGDMFEQRLVVWAVVLMSFFVFAALFWFRNRVVEAVRLEKKRRHRPKLKMQKKQLMAELVGARDELLVQIVGVPAQKNP